MTKYEALKLALEALEDWDSPMALPAIYAIKEALAQPEPPPECKTEEEKTAFAFGWWKALETQRMAQPDYRAVKTYHEGKPVYVSQPEQEPVAWLHWLHGPVHVFLNKDEAMMELDRLNRDYPVDKNARQMKSLYTTPPKRPWVGLTDDEASWCQAPSTIQTWKRIEAKLKELNT